MAYFFHRFPPTDVFLQNKNDTILFICQILDVSSGRRSFSAEHPPAAARLGTFFSEVHERLRRLTLDLVSNRTPDPEEHFGERIDKNKGRGAPAAVAFLSVEEICDTHRSV